ncbi:MAG: hypothetical protein WBE77_09285 [Candidatus Cybelea sp.]
MIVQSLKYKLAAITATSLLSSCVGSSTPTTPPGFRQNQSQVEKRAASPCPCLYVTNTYPNNSVTVYASGATGNALPIRTIIGSNTGLNNPVDIAVGDGGKIYVANYGNGSSEIGSVTVYAAGATGNVAPIQTISGPNTRVQGPDGLALDPVNKHIYVSNTDFGSSFSVTSYASRATGNIMPRATIKEHNTGLSFPAGLTLDSSGNIYVPNGNKKNITVYAAGSVGNVTPMRTISGRGHELDGLEKLALDSSRNTYVSNLLVSTIVVYGAGASGIPTPIATIKGSKTELSLPWGITLDGSNNIYVANEGGGPSARGIVTVYTVGANGDVAPVNTISGSNTGLAEPRGIAIH